MICHCGLNLDLVQRPGYVETMCPACGKNSLYYMTSAVLERNPDIVYVYGENTKREGPAAEWIRGFDNAYGFVTHKTEQQPYGQEEYGNVFFAEVHRLVGFIKANPGKLFFIKKLGKDGDDFEKIIEPELKKMLKNFESVYYFF